MKTKMLLMFMLLLPNLLLGGSVILEESFENLRTKKGWHILKGSIRGDHGVVWKSDDNGLELQRDTVSDSADGQVHAKLDAKHNVKISTKVPTTNANEYTLRLAIKPRDKKGDSSTSAMQINLFKQIVTIRSSSSGELSIKNKNENVKVSQTPQDNGWSKIEINYSDINKSNNALVIRGIGTDDSYGMLLDDIESRSSTQENNATEVIHGHTLPPEPDPVLNNSTLLGIDSNHNGVRDDVERWIYHTYRDKHPIYADIAMQAARGYKLILQTPEKAKEIHDEVRKARHCKFYYKYSAKYFNEPILIQDDFDSEHLREKIYFNTKERRDADDIYDTLLSGDSYTLPKANERKKACDFNTSKYEE